MSWVGRLRVDVGPWRRHRDYRRLLTSQGVTQLGSAITLVAAPLQVKQLTDSFLLVGLLGAIEFVPFVVGGLWGGALADSRDRRRIVLGCEVALLVLSALLLANSLLPSPQVWAVFVVAAGIALAGALQRPASDALLPRVVTTDDLPAAISLQSIVQTSMFLGGPAVGGLLAATHLPAAYALDVVTFVVSAVALFGLRPVPPTDGSAQAGLREIVEGVRYAVSRRDLLGSYAVDIAAMLFAIPDAVFPFLADDLHAPWALGLLYSAAGVGSLVAAATSGWTAHVHRHGLAIVLAAVAWGVAMTLAGLVPGGLWPVLVFLAIAGGADMVSGLFRQTLWNQTIPDELRGRLAGIELLSYTTGPTLGNARAGAMAAFGGARFAIWSGGLLCTGAVLALAAALPTFRRYDARTSPGASAASGGRVRRQHCCRCAALTTHLEQCCTEPCRPQGTAPSTGRRSVARGTGRPATIHEMTTSRATVVRPTGDGLGHDRRELARRRPELRRDPCPVRPRRWRRFGNAVVRHNGPVSMAQKHAVVLANAGPRSMLTSFTGLEDLGLRGWHRDAIHVLVPAGARVRRVPQFPTVVHAVVDWPPPSVHRRVPVHAAAASAVLAASGVSPATHRCRGAGRVCPTGARERGGAGRARASDPQPAAPRHPARRHCRHQDGGAGAVGDRLRTPVPAGRTSPNRCGRPYAPSPAGAVGTSTRSGGCPTVDASSPRWNGALHLAPERWWDDQLRQNEVTIARSIVLRFPAPVVREGDPIVVDQLRRAGVPTLRRSKQCCRSAVLTTHLQQCCTGTSALTPR